jgi:hypothetical protein
MIDFKLNALLVQIGPHLDRSLLPASIRARRGASAGLLDIVTPAKSEKRAPSFFPTFYIGFM